LYAPLFSIRATCPTHLIIFALITRTIIKGTHKRTIFVKYACRGNESKDSSRHSYPSTPDFLLSHNVQTCVLLYLIQSGTQVFWHLRQHVTWIDTVPPFIDLWNVQSVPLLHWYTEFSQLYFTFMLPRIVIDFFLNNQPDAPIIQIYSVIKLYMFRASSLPIIRSSLLYTQHW
jgi:hypothetical protein